MSKNFINIMSNAWMFLLGMLLIMTVFDSSYWWLLVTAMIVTYVSAVVIENESEKGKSK